MESLPTVSLRTLVAPALPSRSKSSSSSSTAAAALPVYIAVFNCSGSYLATGGSDKCVRLWNPLSGLCIKTYTGHGYEVLDIDIARDNSKFASVGGDRAAMLFDVSTGRVIRRFTGHASRINGVAFNAEATVITTGSYDATIKFWDCRSHDQAPIQTLKESTDSVTGVQVVENRILASSVDGHVRVYDIRNGTCTQDNVGHPVTNAVFSNDGNCVLASSLDSTIRLFDIENGEMLAEYTGHDNSNYKITATLTSDDAHVITGSEDGRVCFFDLVEGTLVKSIKPHARLVTSVAYHPKEDIMVTTSTDGSIKVFGT